jgi:hypothetical protein
MAFDLLTRKFSKRDWSRESSLVTIPALPNLANMQKPIAVLITQAKELDKTVRVRPVGRGASVTIQRKWG